VFLYLLTDRDLLNLPDSVASGRFEPPFEQYTWTTTSTPDETWPGLYNVRVTINWPDGERPAAFTASAAQYRRPVVARRR
jgi:hypothetical protein